jgi:hypothetical protein
MKVALGNLVVNVLATGSKVRGFKPGPGRRIFKHIKITSLLIFTIYCGSNGDVTMATSEETPNN